MPNLHLDSKKALRRTANAECVRVLDVIEGVLVAVVAPGVSKFYLLVLRRIAHTDMTIANRKRWFIRHLAAQFVVGGSFCMTL